MAFIAELLLLGVSRENVLSERVHDHPQSIAWMTECPVADQLCRGLLLAAVALVGRSVCLSACRLSVGLSVVARDGRSWTT